MPDENLKKDDEDLGSASDALEQNATKQDTFLEDSLANNEARTAFNETVDRLGVNETEQILKLRDRNFHSS